MREPSNEFVNLEISFPGIIRKINVYIGMDRDFARLCKDFENVSITINFLENANRKTKEKIQAQIASYKQLRHELITDIKSFIQEEQKSH